MPMTQTTVTGPVYLPDGTAPQNAKITFELTSWDREPNEATFVTGPYVADVDINGNFTVNLFSNTNGTNNAIYRVTIVYQDIYNHYHKNCLGNVSLTGAGPFQLSTLNFVDPSVAGSFDLYADILSKDTAYTQKIDTLTVTVNDLSTQVANLATSGIDQATLDQINNNTASINTLNTYLTTANTNIANNTSSINTANTNITNNTNNISSNLSLIQANQTAITNQQNAIDLINLEKVSVTASNITINVAVGESIQTALDKLQSYIYLGQAVGTVLLASGIHILNSALNIQHPQNGKIKIKAATPRSATVSKTEYSGTSTTDLVLLQSKFPVQIECSSSFYSPTGRGDLTVEDILIYAKAGTAATSSNCFLIQDSSYLNLLRTAIHGFSTAVYVQYSSFARLVDCDLTHTSSNTINTWYLGNVSAFTCRLSYAATRAVSIWQTSIFIGSSTTEIFGTSNEGVRAEAGGNAYLNGLIIDSCAGIPLNISKGSTVYSYNSQFNLNGNYVSVTDGSYFYSDNNIFNRQSGVVQLYLNAGATCTLSRANNQLTGGIFQVNNDSAAVETGTHVGSPVFSPTVGTVGNNGAVWR